MCDPRGATEPTVTVCLAVATPAAEPIVSEHVGAAGPAMAGNSMLTKQCHNNAQQLKAEMWAQALGRSTRGFVSQ